MEERNKEALMALEKERLAYMVDWRNRHIEKLQERLAGREEVNNMLQTLLFYALTKAAEQQGESVRTVCIPKEEITAALGRYGCDTVDAGGYYLVSFTEAKRSDDGEGKAQ